MTRNGQIFRPRLELLENRAVPATFTVTTTIDELIPGDGKLSLREALTRANTTAGADVVVVPAGLYKIELALLLGGDFDISDAVTIQGAGAGKSVIDGQQLDRVFDVMGNAPGSIQVVLQGMTVRNGNAAGPGGGIRVGNADLVVRDCAVTGNQASQSGGGISNGSAPGTGDVKMVRTFVARNISGADGGGLHVLGSLSLLTVTDSSVRRNLAGTDGGGISASTATLTNSAVGGNFATNDGGGIRVISLSLNGSTVTGNFAVNDGGGIRAISATLSGSTVSTNSALSNGGGLWASSATLTESTVSSNSADIGGGVIATTATFTNSNLRGNSARNDGGGLWASTSTTLNNSTVSGNSADIGGGIWASSASLTNCTISGNSALSTGGGIFATTTMLLGCTIVENSAHTGGGLFHNPGGAFSVRNTIIALNLVRFTGTNPDVSGTFTSQGHNLIGNSTGGTGFTNGVNGDIVGTSANPIDPKLGPLANNGGRTKTHALLAGSKAIDAGDNAGVPSTDQRGLPRKKDGNFDGLAVVDIGAYEK
jgi:predicted outer membrane repeat protein